MFQIGRTCYLEVKPARRLALFARVSTGHAPFALVGIEVVAACFDLGFRVAPYLIADSAFACHLGKEVRFAVVEAATAASLPAVSADTFGLSSRVLVARPRYSDSISAPTGQSSAVAFLAPHHN